VKFLAGLLLGLLIVPFGLYLYFTGGSAPVATTDSDMPFENYFAHKALNARIAKDMPKNVPIQPTEANYLAGADLYKQHCAVCHGLPLSPKTAIATGMYPHPPLLFEGKGCDRRRARRKLLEDLQRHSPERHARLQQIAFGNADVADRAAAGQCRQAAASAKAALVAPIAHRVCVRGNCAAVSTDTARA
jgi:hypothetical protein